MTSPLLIFALGLSLTTNRGGGLIRTARLAPVASRSRSSRMSEADEKAVGKLEQELSAAVAAEDYFQAAALRDRLAALQMDSEYGALSANSEFYRAFSERDVEGTRPHRDGELSCCGSNATTEDDAHSLHTTSPSPHTCPAAACAYLLPTLTTSACGVLQRCGGCGCRARVLSAPTRATSQSSASTL
mmetsp:Transcript_41252/g.133797  ORF Transcript_41252/g.133797 Transcript_41252/m.133797 type:complete len:187 (+) Transcript_41252:47-607(+)